jgi:transposase
MTRPPRYLLTDPKTDPLLRQQTALIERQALIIEARIERIAALEAERGKPGKTSRNSYLPPSQDPVSGKGNAARKKSAKKTRPSRPGMSRLLAATPDETIV